MNIWKSGPMWARPTMPFEGIVSRQRSGAGFNPGGQFGPAGKPLPSLQRWGKLAPSEQAMQVGIWQDEQQVHSPDILNLMNKIRPTTAKSFAPRWFGGF